MFLHRVLPPPSNLASVPAASNHHSISDSASRGIDEERMPISVERSATEHGSLRGRLFRDQEGAGCHYHQHYQTSRDTELSSPTALRSSTRLARRRERSESPPPSNRNRGDIDGRLPSISRDGDLSNQASPSHICLCQPDPKVPRPRNAFILFRQHHQAAVVQQNPRLANPDISKIIGDAWRTSSEQTKEHWKKLAEEEKIRHQKQYPDYRYQPRRAGKNSLTSCVATDPETQRCLKCGGKTMQTYNNLPTPGTPGSPRPSGPNQLMQGNTILTRSSRYIGSPQYPPPASDHHRFPVSQKSGSLSLRQRDVSDDTPDAKRRRYDRPLSPPSRPGSIVMQSAVYPLGRRSSMPKPDLITRGPSISMSRPHPGSGHPGSAHTRTLGPALAPLQIDKNRDVAAQGKAVEAMVMSIPALNKIKVLSKISPPLAAPGPASPPFDIRGALIAVEGADEEAIKLTTIYLKDVLERDGYYKVKIMHKPPVQTFRDYASWHDTVRPYHNETEEIRKFITTVPGSDSPTSDPPTPNLRHPSKTSTRADSIVTSPSSEKDQALTSPTPTSAATTLRRKDSLYSPSIPILIAPRYQLTLTDQAASQIPINDEYSPQDHWQWMATLWRGLIGPDVTIHIQTPGFGTSSGTPSPHNPLREDQGQGSGNSGGSDGSKDVVSISTGSSGTGQSASSHNHKHLPVVDVRLADARSVFLRGESGGKVGESGLRRMGFEVGEWLRDIEGRVRDGAGR